MILSVLAVLIDIGLWIFFDGSLLNLWIIHQDINIFIKVFNKGFRDR